MEKEKFKLSVSKLKTFEGCKKKYKFTYLDKLPRKEFTFHTFGKLVHRVLEMFHLYYLNGGKDPFNKVMKSSFDSAVLEYKEKLSKEQIDEAFQMCLQYLQIMYDEHHKNIAPKYLGAEKDFTIEIAHDDKIVVMNGCIDRVQLDSDGVTHVCDYKTTKNKRYLKDDDFQLRAYAYVLCKEDPTLTKVRGSYILLRHGFEYITKEFLVDEIMKIEDKFKDIATEIFKEAEFEASPTRLCAWCDHLDLCSEGQEIEPKTFGEVTW